jgi:hypothetical protein
MSEPKQPDRLMPLRLLRYILRILERHVNEAVVAADALPLPVVIPVVLHHGEGGWTAALRLEDLFDRELVQQAGLTELVPRLSFVLDDLSQVSDEALEKRALGLLPLLTLWALRDARNRVRLESAVGHWVPLIAQLLDLPRGQEALWTLFRYIAAVADDTAAQALSQALEATKPQVKGTLMTLAEKWLAEGKAEGKAETLRKLLTLKFGELPEPALARLTAASEAELDRWIERVLNAPTLADAMPL